MNYRKLYRDTFSLRKQQLEGFDIHHIDLNRENNSISNLVALPSELHRQFHLNLSSVPEVITVTKELRSIVDGGNGYGEFSLNALSRYIEIKNECNKWLDYRNYLLGIMPNIHHLSYEERFLI